MTLCETSQFVLTQMDRCERIFYLGTNSHNEILQSPQQFHRRSWRKFKNEHSCRCKSHFPVSPLTMYPILFPRESPRSQEASKFVSEIVKKLPTKMFGSGIRSSLTSGLCNISFLCLKLDFDCKIMLLSFLKYKTKRTKCDL